MKVSIVVRFRNEEPYIEAVLDALSQQNFPHDEYEIIAINNNSTDASRKIASFYTENILTIEDYRPGKALNQAISKARGTYIAIISAHAIPINREWLQHLSVHMDDPLVAGVYGAQLYPVNSKFLDKRDLDLFSTLEPRVEEKDSSFWNANSLLRRSIWEKHPFEDTVFELEDHYWTKQILSEGYKILFEPKALVYHYGHIRRIDREHLPQLVVEEALIEAAVDDLKSENVDWPKAMKAGMTLSSLTHSSYINRSISTLGSILLSYPDFVVRWRMAQALGKIKDKRSVEYLIAALSDTSFFPRDEAAWSLARLGSMASDILLTYLDRFNQESIPFVALALGCSGVSYAEEHAVTLLLTEVQSCNVERERNALYVTGEIAGIKASEALLSHIIKFCSSTDLKLLPVCCWALGCYADQFPKKIPWRKLETLSKFHPDMLTRFEATVALGKLGYIRPNLHIQRCLIDRLRDSDSRVRYGAAQSLRRIAEKGMLLGMEQMRGWEDNDFGVMYEIKLIERYLQSLDGKKLLMESHSFGH